MATLFAPHTQAVMVYFAATGLHCSERGNPGRFEKVI